MFGDFLGFRLYYNHAPSSSIQYAVPLSRWLTEQSWSKVPHETRSSLGRHLGGGGSGKDPPHDYEWDSNEG